MNKEIKNKVILKGKQHANFTVIKSLLMNDLVLFSLYWENCCVSAKLAVRSYMRLINLFCQDISTRKRIIAFTRRIGNSFIVMIHCCLNP